MRVADRMRGEPIAVTPVESLGQASRLLARHRLGAVPMVRGSALVGLLTEDDLLEVLAALLDEDPPPDRARGGD